LNRRLGSTAGTSWAEWRRLV